MDVDVFVFIELWGYAKLLCTRPCIAVCGLSRFLHYVAQMSGQCQLATPFHNRCLDIEDLTSNRRPGKSRGNADLVFFAFFFGHMLGNAKILVYLSWRNRSGLCRSTGDFFRDLATYPCDLTLDVSKPCFACVLCYDLSDGLVGKLYEFIAKSVFFNLPGYQIPVGYDKLFFACITRDIDNLHPVFKRAGDWIHLVCRSDEHDICKVKWQVQVMVAKGIVLLRVQDLQQGRRRIPPEVRADLVYFIHHKDGVIRTCLLHPLNYASRKSTDIGAPVSSYLCFIANAT